MSLNRHSSYQSASGLKRMCLSAIHPEHLSTAQGPGKHLTSLQPPIPGLPLMGSQTEVTSPPSVFSLYLTRAFLSQRAEMMCFQFHGCAGVSSLRTETAPPLILPPYHKHMRTWTQAHLAYKRTSRLILQGKN